MMVKASEEPMIIRLTTEVKSRLAQTALMGTPHFGGTYESHLLNGRPPSRAKA